MDIKIPLEKEKTANGKLLKIHTSRYRRVSPLVEDETLMSVE
jgi:hypothetical protein